MRRNVLLRIANFSFGLIRDSYMDCSILSNVFIVYDFSWKIIVILIGQVKCSDYYPLFIIRYTHFTFWWSPFIEKHHSENEGVVFSVYVIDILMGHWGMAIIRSNNLFFCTYVYSIRFLLFINYFLGRLMASLGSMKTVICFLYI